MKKSIILLLCAATILFSACNQNAPVNKQREVKKLVLSPQDEAINVHQNEFTLNLLKQANANETESENVFLSPLSVSILLVSSSVFCIGDLPETEVTVTKPASLIAFSNASF